MTWTQPKTWSSEPLTSTDLNTHLRDNLEALKDPPSAWVVLDEDADYTTTSTVFVAVDDTTLSLTIITNGGDVLAGFMGSFRHLAPNRIALDIDVDGNPHAGDEGIITFIPSGTGIGASAQSFVRLIPGLAAGSHTFKLQWRTASGTATLHAGAGVTHGNVHPQFWVREVS